VKEVAKEVVREKEVAAHGVNATGVGSTLSKPGGLETRTSPALASTPDTVMVDRNGHGKGIDLMDTQSTPAVAFHDSLAFSVGSGIDTRGKVGWWGDNVISFRFSAEDESTVRDYDCLFLRGTSGSFRVRHIGLDTS